MVARKNVVVVSLGLVVAGCGDAAPPGGDVDAAGMLVDAAGMVVDASRFDGSASELDGSAPELDGSAPELDGSAPELDGSAPELDAGAVDGGPEVDAGACPAGVLCSASPLYTSKIGLWYALWWRTTDDGHWAEWSRYTPTIGRYTSGDPATFPSERASFDAMHVDFLLLDHTNGIGADGGALATAGRQIVASLESSPSSLRQAAAIGACFWVSGVSDREACMAAEADAIWSDHADPSRHPSSFLFHGAPLLVNYTAPGAHDTWSDARFTVGAATGRSAEASAAQLSLGLWGWVFDDPTPTSRTVMGVTPGWNTAHLGRDTTPLDREGGARFMRQWLRAIRQNPDAIIVSSWNDFAEETAIQPARPSDESAPPWTDAAGNACPSFYADIARTYSLLRWGLAIGAFVREEGASDVFEVTSGGLVAASSTPACSPVVEVPAGYLAEFAPPCAPTRGAACTASHATDFGGFCWPSGSFDAAAFGFEGCACAAGACAAGSAVCTCAGPAGRVDCAGSCGLELPTSFDGACWPDGSFDGADRGFGGCSCTRGSCAAGSSVCTCTTFTR